MSIQDQIQLMFSLAAISTASLAFVSGLYAFFDSHSRLQESAYGLLSTIFLFSLSTTMLVVAMIVTAESYTIISGWTITEISLGLFIFGWLILFYTFFMLYGRVSHLRDRRFLKYVFPFSIINDLRSRKYALTVKPRTAINIGPYQFSSEEAEIISKGYMFVFTGSRQIPFQEMAIDFLIDGLKNNETANYVCCNRPPYQIWDWIKKKSKLETSLHKRILIIDAFSSHLGYDDEILKDANEEVEREGVSIVSAKGIAGIHSGANTAWYKTKEILKKEGISYRIPNRMIYDCLSELSTISSKESVRAFYQHTIAAERKYGMLSVFIEPDNIEPSLLSALESVSDGVFVFSENESKQIEVEAKKLHGIDLRKHSGKKIWDLK